MNDVQRELLKNSYRKPSKQKHQIGDYIRDDSLSGGRAQIYANPLNNEDTIVVHRGSASAEDWGTNLRLGLGMADNSKRDKHAKMVHEQVKDKYGHYAGTTLGHSQGGKWAEKYGRHKVVTVNKASLPQDIGKKIHKRQHDVRHMNDPVSAFSAFQRHANPVKTFHDFRFNPHGLSIFD